MSASERTEGEVREKINRQETDEKERRREKGEERREKREWECEGREGLHATSREKGGGGGEKVYGTCRCMVIGGAENSKCTTLPFIGFSNTPVLEASRSLTNSSCFPCL